MLRNFQTVSEEEFSAVRMQDPERNGLQGIHRTSSQPCLAQNTILHVASLDKDAV